ncbi:MAG: DUF3078 domain-containing protein [bacterium]
MQGHNIRLLLTVCLLFVSGILTAQESAQDSSKYGWKNEIIGNLNLTQASFSNWEQGGENSFAWQVKLATKFTLEQENYDWSNTGKFVFGFAKVGDAEARKSADEINLESVYTRKLSKFLNPFLAVTAKSQFVAGFEYFDDNTKNKISKFLDPGYFTQSFGLGYAPNSTFKTRLGAMVKETVTDIFPEESKVEGGISSVTDFNANFEENVLFTSKLNLFSNLKAFNRIDVLWENNLILKVTKYINVQVNVDILYDRDISSRRQVKQVLAVGFTYAFLE